MRAKSIPAGRVAFYVDPDNELHYSVVKVRNRYADGFDVIELPRGEPDDFYINPSLPAADPRYRVVVERSKERKTLQRLGITDEGDAIEVLKAHGYRHERTESLAEAAARELKEEHGFDQTRDPAMAQRIINMHPFPVAASYGAGEEYRDFVQIEGDIGGIALNVTDKREMKAPARLGVAYQEAGGWASLRDIRQNADAFVALAERDRSDDRERLLGEAYYQKSIAAWLESAEAALVGVLRRAGIPAQTTSPVPPALALRATGAAVCGLSKVER